MVSPAKRIAHLGGGGGGGGGRGGGGGGGGGGREGGGGGWKIEGTFLKLITGREACSLLITSLTLTLHVEGSIIVLFTAN